MAKFSRSTILDWNFSCKYKSIHWNGLMKWNKRRQSVLDRLKRIKISDHLKSRLQNLKNTGIFNTFSIMSVGFIWTWGTNIWSNTVKNKIKTLHRTSYKFVILTRLVLTWRYVSLSVKLCKGVFGMFPTSGLDHSSKWTEATLSRRTTTGGGIDRSITGRRR